MLARRISADGRTRAYAWGRSAAREDVAALGERLLAMSGQFEQRRLARPAYQLAVLDAFCGEEQLRRRAEARLAWRELGAARRRHDELTRDAAAAEARLAELRALVEDTEGMEPGHEEALRDERERLRHLTELVEGDGCGRGGARPGRGRGRRRADGRRGAGAGAGRAARARARRRPPTSSATPSSASARRRARCGRSCASLEADPGRLEQVEAELDRIADARRRFRCASLRRAARPRGRGAGGAGARSAEGHDPAAAAREALAQRGGACRRSSRPRSGRRGRRPPSRSRRPSPRELRGIGMGDGEFQVELRERDPGATGADEASFLIRPNRGAAVRAGRRDGVRRRALPRRARDRGGRRRRDDGLRRDRRRHRRHDRARRRRHARAARRARPGGHDHAPAADRQPRRPALPGREDPRRPDPHAHPGAVDRRAQGGARAYARRPRVPLDPRANEHPDRVHRPGAPRPADEAPRPPPGRGRRRDRRPRRPRPRHRRGAARDRRARGRQRRRVALRAASRTPGRSCSCAAA